MEMKHQSQDYPKFLGALGLASSGRT